MQQNNLSLWKYDKTLDCMLFFAQRVNELLFHHTTDTYRLPAVSLRGLAKEFCTVYRDSQKGIINLKNLKHILDEFNDRLQNDPVAKKLLTDEYVERFSKNCGSWDAKTQFENINYIGRKLSNLAYYQEVTTNLKDLIIENKQKKAIDTMSILWVREAIDCGYNANYIYNTLNVIFYHSTVDSLDSLNQFFDKFDFTGHRFDVFIGFSKDMSAIKALFERIHIRKSKISVLTPDKVPQGIKTKNQQTILKFEEIQALDMFSAHEIAYEISTCVADSYDFFRHNRSAIRTYGQVMSEDKVITTINPKHLLKYRVSSLSQLDSEKNADLLLTALFSNRKNQVNIRKIITIHNAAIKSENISDSLLSLWSLLESLVEDNNGETQTGEPSGEHNVHESSRNKSGKVIEILIPFLKSTYVEKLVRTFMADVMHWDQSFFDNYIAQNGFGSNDLEHTFAFLAFDSTQPARDELYARAEKYPLLKNRVMVLYEQFHNSKNIKATITHHEQRVRWHLYRIYRARNYIVHDASGDEELNQELLINLHSYIDTLVSKAVEFIDASPYNDNISNVISDHKLEVSILDEMLTNQESEDITETNALKYLYYDYKQ